MSERNPTNKRTKTGGRKKGTPNKSTAAIKSALIEAFDELGGIPALVRWGKKYRTEFYKLWSKLLPLEVKNADGEKFRVAIVEEIIDAHVSTNREATLDSAAVSPE